jgi:histidyl-tRNA synthetase
VTENITSLRGMPDVLPEKSACWREVERVWMSVMAQYGYVEIRLPVLEKTALFKRAIGEVTDIVEKEMFTLQDRDKESIALRPEGTAGCIRAGIEHGLLYNQTQKWWYEGSMFRYERPQKGRYRQFHQLGVEAFGFYDADIELEQFLLVGRFFKALGISDAITLEVNSLGSAASRQIYRDALIQYWEKQGDALDGEAKRRLYTNPLRILDSKVPSMQPLIAAAPQLRDYWDAASRDRFEQLLEKCDALGIAYRINPRLVRGLDYYNGLVYEWTTTALGAQGTLCAGGRYDNLVEQLGGKPTAGIGFGIGIERVLLLVEQQSTMLKGSILPMAYVVFEGEKGQALAFDLLESWRNALPQLRLMMHLGGGSLKTQFKKADKSGADWALILGEREIDTKTVSIKWLRQSEKPQQSIAQEDMLNWFTKYLQGNGE